MSGRRMKPPREGFGVGVHACGDVVRVTIAEQGLTLTEFDLTPRAALVLANFADERLAALLATYAVQLEPGLRLRLDDGHHQ